MVEVVALGYHGISSLEVVGMESSLGCEDLTWQRCKLCVGVNLKIWGDPRSNGYLEMRSDMDLARH